MSFRIYNTQGAAHSDYLVQTFKNPKPALAAALAESGSMENGVKKKGDESAKKKKRPGQGASANHGNTSIQESD